MIKQWSLSTAAVAFGLMSSLAWAQSGTHVSGHRTGSNAKQAVKSGQRASGSHVSGHRTGNHQTETRMSSQRNRSRSMAGNRSSARQRYGAASTHRRNRASANARSSAALSPRLFMTKAAQINIGEIRGGQLALTRALNANVREYAQHMIEEHNSANRLLKQLAASERVKLPNDTDRKHKAIANRLAKFHGSQFDRAYMRAMVQGHQDAVRLFERQAANGNDPEVRAYASRMLPALREHLIIAQRLYNTRAVQTGEKMRAPMKMNLNNNASGEGGQPNGGQTNMDEHAGHDH